MTFARYEAGSEHCKRVDMNRSVLVLVLVLLLHVLVAHGGAVQTEQGPAADKRPKAPFNEILVLWPIDGDVVELEALDVDIVSGYGVLTFVSITLNKVKVIDVETIDAGNRGTLTVAKGKLRIGKNVLKVESWHQLPGSENRLAKFTAPLINFTVKKPQPKK